MNIKIFNNFTMMFPNINEMNNLVYLQNLKKMKPQLAKFESEFNSLIPQLKNKGIDQELVSQLNHMSFHFINFGIQMLGIVIQIIKNNKFDFSDIKERINHTSNHLNNMSNNIQNKTIPEINNENTEKSEDSIIYQNYEVKFESYSNDIEKLITFAPHITVDDLIKEFLININRKDLFDNEDEEISFYYDDERLDTLERKTKKLYQIFGNITNPVVYFQFITS